MDYRSGIDVMTTETACLSSVWSTDEITRAHLTALGRGRSSRLRPLPTAPGMTGCWRWTCLRWSP